MSLFFLADIPLRTPTPMTLPMSGALWDSAAAAFILTVLLEWPLLAWWSRRGLRRTAGFALLVNGLTWGTAMGLLYLWPIPVPLLEAAIVVAEAALLTFYWQWSWKKSLPISLGMNLASWLIGSTLLLLFARHA
jgi:hypothetical protein